jgi:hypothetical protein
MPFSMRSDPSSDGTVANTVWIKYNNGSPDATGTYASHLIKATVTEPTAPPTNALYIYAIGPDASTYDCNIVMDSPFTGSESISTIDLWAYAVMDAGTDVQFAYTPVGGSPSSFQSFGVQSLSWQDKNWGGLSLTGTQCNGLTITLRMDNSKGDQTFVYALYLVYTYFISDLPPIVATVTSEIGAPDWINGITTLLPGSFRTRYKPSYAMSKSGLYLLNKGLAL